MQILPPAKSNDLDIDPQTVNVYRRTKPIVLSNFRHYSFARKLLDFLAPMDCTGLLQTKHPEYALDGMQLNIAKHIAKNIH